MLRNYLLHYIKKFLFFLFVFLVGVPILSFGVKYACADGGNTRKIASLRGTDATISQLKKDRERLAEKIEKVRSINRQYSKKIKELEGTLAKLQKGEKFYKENAQTISEENLKNSNDEVTDREKKTLELLAKIDAFAEEDEKLKRDAGIAHYNMGNIYFQKGEYEIAYREYYQAVTLMPNDPDAHYNLAFVCGEYLGDYKTALKHYRMYLYLKPNAKDAYIVRGKIREAEIALKSIVDSPLENKDTK